MAKLNQLEGVQMKKRVIEELWSPEYMQAFEKLNSALITTPVLDFPDFSLLFILEADFSYRGLWAILFQIQDGKKGVLAYTSRTLRPPERSTKKQFKIDVIMHQMGND